MKDDSRDCFPFRCDAEMRVFGSFARGGWAEVRTRKSKSWTKIRLPQALFALLAVLILAAKQVPAGESWVPTGFMSIAAICQEIKRRTRATASPLLPDEQHVTKYMFRLRQRFAGIRLPGVHGDWAKSLLEFVPLLGYRLSVPPENLLLTIITEPDETQRDDTRSIERRVSDPSSVDSLFRHGPPADGSETH